MNRQSLYAADIPAEPEGLEIVVDKDGDVWQRTKAPSDPWRCTRNKVMGQFMGFNGATWCELVITFGPLKPIQWNDAA